MARQFQFHPPHKWVSERIGYTVAGVSLLRNGRRQPDIQTMLAMEKGFNWPAAEQLANRRNYAAALNQMLKAKYDQETEQEKK